MSDFDEEAERERLREKYERDKRKRQATERMSDLLLKGATMTNAHCGECGDPIFRHDGQEFCPSCETVVGQVDDGQAAGGEAGTADDVEEEGTDEDDGDRTSEDSTAADDPRSTADDTPSTASNATTDADSSGSIDVEAAPSVDPADATATDSGTDPAPDTGPVADPTGARRSDGRREPTAGPVSTSPAGHDSESAPTAVETEGDSSSSDLSPARTALTRTVNELARTAAASDDLGRTREYLVAAREAAEALDAVESADR